MDLEEYQAKMVEIWETNKTPEEQLLYCCVGMAEESGEVMGKVKRLMRGEAFDREGYLLELGDCLAYFVIAANSRNINTKNLCHALSVLSNQPVLNTTVYLNERITSLLSAVFREDDEFAEGELNPNIANMFRTILVSISWCCCSDLVNSSLEEVMQMNLKKLADRKARNGHLRGSGDKR